MHDFGGVGWQRLTFLAVFRRNHFEHASHFRECFFSSRHEGVATRNRRHLGDPAFRLIPVEDDFVIVQSHLLQF